jgi:hypothetical protein
MSWVATAVAGGTAIAGGVGAISRNSKRPKAPSFQPYNGPRPPQVEGLRDVEKMVRETLMRRSQGDDVGYDPRRRQDLLTKYELENKKSLERQKDDINNHLSGMGLSRNLRAVDALYNRAMEDNKTASDLYRTNVDIEDLTRANQERDVNTARLQDLNTFNFGQENTRANFDKSVYDSEQGNRFNEYGAKSNYYDQYQDPIGTGVEAGLAAFGALKSPVMASPSNTANATNPASSAFQDKYGISELLNKYSSKYKNLSGK